MQRLRGPDILGHARHHAVEISQRLAHDDTVGPERELADRVLVHACAALVKPGGWVFFSTINRNAKAFAFAIVGAEHVLKLLPKGTHEYAKFILPSELARWVREAGLLADGFRGMAYNPFTQRYWLSDDTSVNYLLACRRPA